MKFLLMKSMKNLALHEISWAHLPDKLWELSNSMKERDYEINT